jgi:heat shock protein HslJ
MQMPSSPRPLAIALFVVAVGLLAAACSSGATSAPAASPSAGSSLTVLSLEGPDWRLGSYVGPEGGTLQVPEGLAATARFQDGTVSGTSGCNSYSGPYTVDGDSLTIGQLAITSMACEALPSALETAYLAALGRVTTYAIVGDTLELRASGGATVLSFTASAAPDLAATRWVALSINNGSGGVTSVVAGSTVTATFGSGGELAGSGGCNDYSGSYTVDGSSMTIGPLAATKKACADPAIQQQEDRYFAALGEVATYAFSGDQLELRDASGGLLVRYAPAGG